MQIFIVGPARSGTSALLRALHDVLVVPAEGESHVMPAFQRAIHQFAVYCEQLPQGGDMLAHALDPANFRAHVAGYVQAFYGARFPAGSFVDKTPGAEAIAGAPLIRQIFPDARIIVTRRSGLEAVESHVGKFGAAFDDACQGWRACMQAIEEIRPATTDLFEIDHHELACQPEQAAARLCQYLRAPDHAKSVASHLRSERHDSAWNHDWQRLPRLQDMGWTTAQQQCFLETCGPHMDRFGYPI